MLKLIFTPLNTICGLPLKKNQFNKIIRLVEFSFLKFWYSIRKYFADLIANFAFLLKITNFLRPRKKLFLIRFLLICLSAIFYFSFLPSTFVNAIYPEKVIPERSESAVITIRESITLVKAPEFKAPIFGNISTYFSSYHRGVDIPNPKGTLVKAFTDGEVVFAGWSNGGFGNLVVIQHKLGLVSRYAHLAEINVVLGQKLESGEVIGKVGSTGNSTGSHLHFEIYQNGKPLNPLNFVSFHQ